MSIGTLQPPKEAPQGFAGQVWAAVGDWDRMKRLFTGYQKEIRLYCTVILLMYLVFHFLSDGDFSFLLTLGSMISMSSFMLVCACIATHKSCQGISVKMLEVYLLVQFGRLVAIVPFEGYLPFDKSGDWFYQVVEAITFCLAGGIVYMCRVKYPTTYNSELDTFDTRYIIFPCFAISVVWHPSLNAFMPSDIMWAYALYLESLASLPQLFMFQREGQVHPWTAHFLFAQACAKVANFVFWISSFSELHDPTHIIKSYIGYWVLAVQGFQLLIMGDFILQYTKCVGKGVSVSMLLSEQV
mmetsp:Transcript_8055/g.19444  ORF Transcript_8055/g.19444 Transcript_8055/m.19444 type:complete len:298 (+) Transcript_8055:611-1504(+)|eukprot:g1397.t1